MESGTKREEGPKVVRRSKRRGQSSVISVSNASLGITLPIIQHFSSKLILSISFSEASWDAGFATMYYLRHESNTFFALIDMTDEKLDTPARKFLVTVGSNLGLNWYLAKNIRRRSYWNWIDETGKLSSSYQTKLPKVQQLTKTELSDEEHTF